MILTLNERNTFGKLKTMKLTRKYHVPEVVSHFNPRGFFLNIPVIHKLRYLIHKAVNILSMILVSLFADFYPTLKH